MEYKIVHFAVVGQSRTCHFVFWFSIYICSSILMSMISYIGVITSLLLILTLEKSHWLLKMQRYMVLKIILNSLLETFSNWPRPWRYIFSLSIDWLIVGNGYILSVSSYNFFIEMKSIEVINWILSSASCRI